MAPKRWAVLLGVLVCALLLAAFVSAQEDDEMPGKAVPGQDIDEIFDGVDAEEAAEDIAENVEDDDEAPEGGQFGVRSGHYLPQYADLKVPAGERVEIIIPISSVQHNPTYEVFLVAGHISLLDHSRFIQNFSAQLYNRTLEGGETITVKYTVTPDAQLDPMEYAFVVAAYMRNVNDNTSILVPAVNGTMVVLDPLGVDFKGYFSIVAFVAAIAGTAYYFIMNRKPSRTVAARRKEAVETGTNDSAYDPDFVDKSHIDYVQSAAAKRPRSASPKK